MNIKGLLLLPVSLLYGMITSVRNMLFDLKIFRQKKHDVIVISVGNLSMGGTGKTPHVEFIINFLKKHHHPAMLSRGYKRKTKGFKIVDQDDTSATVGDEPMQYFNKYDRVPIAVDENRNHGVVELLKKDENIDAIVLDDAFQHRWIKSDLSILLTDYHHLFSQDYVFPSGSLREFRSGYKRADIIVVTKTPVVLSPFTRRRITSEIKIKKHQKLLFSRIEYKGLVKWNNVGQITDDIKVSTTILFTGIENPYPLKEYLMNKCNDLIFLPFPDHHDYTEKDIRHIFDTYNEAFTSNKNIVTTEKDIQRLNISPNKEILKNLPLYYVPIHVVYHDEDDKIIKDSLSSLFEK